MEWLQLGNTKKKKSLVILITAIELCIALCECGQA